MSSNIIYLNKRKYAFAKLNPSQARWKFLSLLKINRAKRNFDYYSIQNNHICSLLVKY